MNIASSQVAAALDAVSDTMARASRHFDDYITTDDEWAKANAEWSVQLAYSQMIVLAEALAMPLLRLELASALQVATEEDLLASVQSPDGEQYLKHMSLPQRIRLALRSTFLAESSQTVTKDLEAILRAATYAITDAKAFGGPPTDEDSVHRRIEAVLRCVFPDLLHKPRLAKAIKNFEPDTGIPSIGTLLEYKFIATPEQVPVVADQVLADTRGYHSRDWQSFVYVIYETRRLRPEAEWRQLLRECGVRPNTSVVVLSGEPPPSSKKRRRITRAT